MARVRDVLYRFRPAGTPGAAGAAGVPTDRVADLATELAPVFALIEPAERDCAAIVASAEREAAEIRERAAAQARLLTADARAHADADRAQARAEALERTAAESAGIQVAAQRSAEELRSQAEERIPALLEQAVAAVRVLTGAVPENPAAGPG
jgi:hypothetical protein